MAIAYDFDGTLADGNMQEHQFLPDIGMKPTEFWNEVKRLTKKHQADEVLVYMNLMLRKATAAEVSVRQKDFEEQGKKIQLFDGVKEWFKRINNYGTERVSTLNIISSHRETPKFSPERQLLANLTQFLHQSSCSM